MHITSKRYYYRAEKRTKVKVYSNCDEVTLFVNGKEYAKQKGRYIFTFEVPLRRFGITRIKAVSGKCTDTSEIKFVRKPYDGYILKSTDNVDNWFDKDSKFDFKFPEGYFSIKDKLNDIMAIPEGNELFNNLIDTMVKGMMSDPNNSQGKVEIPKSMLKLAGGMSIEKIAKMTGDKLTPEMLFEINEKLNKIKKP